MLQTITQALQDGSSGIVALPLAFALGLVSAMASTCCALPAMGMLVSYSGTREAADKRSTLALAVWKGGRHDPGSGGRSSGWCGTLLTGHRIKIHTESNQETST